MSLRPPRLRRRPQAVRRRPLAGLERTSTKAPKDDDGKHCAYMFTKGVNEGKACGSKVCEESTSGLFCKRHVGQEKKGDEKKTPAAGGKKATAAGTKTAAKGKGKSAKAKSEAKEAEAPAIQNLKETVPVHHVRMNKWRNYEHEGTGFVIDRNTQMVYGIQKSDGTVTQLTAEDLEACHALGFGYQAPANLVSKADREEEEPEEPEEDDEEEDDEEADEDDD